MSKKINYVCVKSGQKYSAMYVNRLFTAIKKFSPVEFDFFCYTDNPTSISQDIKIIDVKTDLEKWWLKIDLFGMFTKNDTILLDLDIVILKKLDILTSIRTSGLTLLYSNWKNHFIPPEHLERFPTLYNSSIVKWSGNQATSIYDYFYQDKEKYMLKYKGVDRFLYNEPVLVDTLPTSIAYSYWKGAHYVKDNLPEVYRPKYEICILNEGKKNHEISTWIDNFWK